MIESYEKENFMIICIYGYGNHSNRLLQNIHFEAFCKEYGIDYINPSFTNMYKYYISPCKLRKGLKGIFFTFNLFVKILKKLKIIKNIISFDCEENNNMNLLPLPPPPP
jgi:hypothetical protein